MNPKSKHPVRPRTDIHDENPGEGDGGDKVLFPTEEKDDEEEPDEEAAARRP